MDIRVAQAGKIAGHVVAFALDWRLLDPQSPNQRLRNEAAMRHSNHGVLVPAIDPNKKVPTVLGGILPMGSPRATTGAYAAAAWLALARPDETFVLAHDLGDGRYWMIRLDNGFFSPQSDVILEERAVSDAIHEVIIARGDAQKVSLVYTGRRPTARTLLTGKLTVIEMTIDELFATTPPKLARIRQIRGMAMRHWLALFAVVAFVLCSVAGLLWYRQYQQQKEVAAAAAELALREAQDQELRTLHDVRQREAVLDQLALDTATPSPDGMVHACLARVRTVDKRLGGWNLVDLECNLVSGQLQSRYLLPDGATGTSETLVAAATASGMTASPGLGTNQAVVDAVFGQPVPRRALLPAELPRGIDLATRFAARFQLGARAAIRSSIGPPGARPVVYRDPSEATGTPTWLPVPPERAYQEGTLTLTGDDLWQADQIAMDYPFVVLTKLTVRSSDTADTWLMEGKYYASPN